MLDYVIIGNIGKIVNKQSKITRYYLNLSVKKCCTMQTKISTLDNLTSSHVINTFIDSYYQTNSEMK